MYLPIICYFNISDKDIYLYDLMDTIILYTGDYAQSINELWQATVTILSLVGPSATVGDIDPAGHGVYADVVTCGPGGFSRFVSPRDKSLVSSTHTTRA